MRPVRLANDGPAPPVLPYMGIRIVKGSESGERGQHKPGQQGSGVKDDSHHSAPRLQELDTMIIGPPTSTKQASTQGKQSGEEVFIDVGVLPIYRQS